MPSIRIGGWVISVIPGDHSPPHVHAYLGSHRGYEIILELNDDVDIVKVDKKLSDNDVRIASRIVFENRDRLLDLWKRYHP